MAYADFAYYSGTYMGTVSEENFPRLAVRASSFLDYYTLNKAKDNADLDAVKMCCCALVDKYAVIEAAQALANYVCARLYTDRTGRVCVKHYPTVWQLPRCTASRVSCTIFAR